MLDTIQNFITQLNYMLIIPGLAIGAILYFMVDVIPFVPLAYKIPAKVLGGLLILFFTFQLGKQTLQHEFEYQTAKQAEIISNLKLTAGKVDIKTVVEYKDKIQYVDRWKEVNVDHYITQEANSKCVIDTATSDNIRMLFNLSAKGGNLPTTGASNGSPSKAN